MKTPADSDKGKDRKRKKDDDGAAPEVVVVSVSPPRPPPPAKPGADEVWVTLLESSPWSSKGAAQGERTPPAPLRSTLAAGNEPVTRWSEPVWRSPVATEAPDAAIDEPVPVTAAETAAIDPRAAVTSLADLVRSGEPLLSRADPEDLPVAEPVVPPQPIFAAEMPDVPEISEVPEPVGAVAPEVEAAEPEPVAYVADVPEIEVQIRVDEVEMAPSVEEPPMAEEPAAPVAVDEPVAAEPEVAVESEIAVEPEIAVELPEPVAVQPQAPKAIQAGPRYEVPVEDLLGGVFGLAGSAVRGVVTTAAGLVGGLVKGGRMVGSGLVSGTRRLTSGAGGCQGCSDSDCGSEAKK